MARLAENTKMVAAVVLAAALSASAVTRTWNGGGDGSTWADARNWGGTAPAAGDDVVVSATSVKGAKTFFCKVMLISCRLPA